MLLPCFYLVLFNVLQLITLQVRRKQVCDSASSKDSEDVLSSVHDSTGQWFR